MKNNELDLTNEQITFIANYLREMKKFSKETYNHIIDVSQLSLMMAKEANLSLQETKDLYVGALLHDIGKLQIPSEVLHKPKLTDEEFGMIKNHSQLGYDALGELFSDDVKNLVVNHHEKPNGRGYPKGLKDNELSQLDKILAVCDVTSALKLPRCYKEGMQPEQIVSILNENAMKGDLDEKSVNLMVDTYLNKLIEEKESQKVLGLTR
ncbi:MAG: HD domain-containing protein [Clostridia bacterium]|nr:HD domain-containing protein [Clostridia bacterium]